MNLTLNSFQRVSLFVNTCNHNILGPLNPNPFIKETNDSVIFGFSISLEISLCKKNNCDARTMKKNATQDYPPLSH